jgi:hypothetical protein
LNNAKPRKNGKELRCSGRVSNYFGFIDVVATNRQKARLAMMYKITNEKVAITKQDTL